MGARAWAEAAGGAVAAAAAAAAGGRLLGFSSSPWESSSSSSSSANTTTTSSWAPWGRPAPQQHKVVCAHAVDDVAQRVHSGQPLRHAHHLRPAGQVALLEGRGRLGAARRAARCSSGATECVARRPQNVAWAPGIACWRHGWAGAPLSSGRRCSWWLSRRAPPALPAPLRTPAQGQQATQKHSRHRCPPPSCRRAKLAPLHPGAVCAAAGGPGSC